MVVHLTIRSNFKTYNDFGFIALDIVGDKLGETPGVLWLPGLVGCTKKSRMTCGGARRNFSKAGDDDFGGPLLGVALLSRFW